MRIMVRWLDAIQHMTSGSIKYASEYVNNDVGVAAVVYAYLLVKSK